MSGFLVAVTVIPACILLALACWLTWLGTRWGGSPAERAMSLPGDDWIAEEPMGKWPFWWTRAVSIEAPPDTVWPWLVQLGRGAGFYSYDRLDNGGKSSARHLLSWVTEPRLGDASAIGYLRHVVPGRDIAWWMPPLKTGPWTMRMSACYRITSEGQGSRLVLRVGGDVTGFGSAALKFLFALIDSIMARRQLLGMKSRAETFGTRDHDPGVPETGAHDQFQLYEFICADGFRGGVSGKEQAPRWSEAAKAELGKAFGRTGRDRSRLPPLEPENRHEQHREGEERGGR